jgi:hypothetical protein
MPRNEAEGPGIGTLSAAFPTEHRFGHPGRVIVKAKTPARGTTAFDRH